MPIARRNLLQLLLTGAAASLSGCQPAFTVRRQPDLSDPQELLDAYQRLSGSFDDRLVIWWMSGKRYGVVNAQSRALYGMEVGMFHRFYRQPDGSFRIAFFELTYYTDLATGALLESFENPYTGATNRVRHVRLGPEIRELSVNGLMSEDNPLIQSYETSLGPAVVNDDRIWIPASVEATIRFPKPAAPEILINIYTTVQGSLAAATNPAVVSADCTLEFHNVLKWEPWMQMGDHPGHMMSTASGRKLESMDELPASYLAMAEQVHGKYIADPVETLRKYSDRIVNG